MAVHELSIAQSITEIACRHADGRRISKIELKVGQLRQVVPSALTFSFQLVAEGTLAEGAELQIESVPVVARCRPCGAESQLDCFPFQCRICDGFDLGIVTGEELEVESIECLEESDNVPRPSENVRR
jgi:hydrogenase nickel incorporation protein HypA/HybF